MPHLALSEFLDELQHEQQLARVTAEVDPELELAAIARRVAAQLGPALVFAHVRGRDVPLATNLLGTPERVFRSLGVRTAEAVQARAAELMQGSFSGGWLEALRMASPQARWAPRAVRTGASQQVVRLASDVDLQAWFRVRSWPEDEAPSLNPALACVQAADDSWRSIELCSATFVDRNRLSLAWEPHRRLAQLWQDHVRRGERMPLALLLGGPPLQTLVAAAPLATDIDRWTLCGWLRDRACDLVRCRTLPIDIPADAEIVVEGYIDPKAPLVPAPRCADWSGSYRLPAETVLMQVSAITHRTNPMQVYIQPQSPPHELATIRHAMLDALRPLVLAAVPGLVDFYLPAAAGCRHVAFVSIRKVRSHQARQIAGALWALEPWMFARLMIVVDEDANVRDQDEILRRLVTCVDLGKDVFFQPGSADTGQLSASGQSCVQMGIDATRKLPSEGPTLWPATLNAAIIEAQVAARWLEYGLGPWGS